MHSLRHSFASILIAAGTPITEVAGLLGHSSPAVTLRIYSHWLRDLKTGSTDRLASALLGSGGHLVDTLAEQPSCLVVNDDENALIIEGKLVPPARFERATPGLGILRSKSRRTF
jgi:Phage integrase family